MKGLIIIRGTKDGKINRSINAHVSMRIGRFEKVKRKLVGDSENTEILSFVMRKNTFYELRKELNEFYPNRCIFVVDERTLA